MADRGGPSSGSSASVRTHHYLQAKNLQWKGKDIGGIKMGVITSAPDEGSNTALAVAFDIFRLADKQDGTEVAKGYFMPCLVKTRSGTLVNGVHIVKTGARSDYLRGAQDAIKAFLASNSVKASRRRLRVHRDGTLTQGVERSLEEYVPKEGGKLLCCSYGEGWTTTEEADDYFVTRLTRRCPANEMSEEPSSRGNASAPTVNPDDENVGWPDTVCFWRPCKSILGRPLSSRADGLGPFPISTLMYVVQGGNRRDVISAMNFVDLDPQTSKRGGKQGKQEGDLVGAIEFGCGIIRKLTPNTVEDQMAAPSVRSTLKWSNSFFDEKVSLASHNDLLDKTDKFFLDSIKHKLGPESDVTVDIVSNPSISGIALSPGAYAGGLREMLPESVRDHSDAEMSTKARDRRAKFKDGKHRNVA